LVLEAVHRPDTRCQAIAASLIRNYVDARVIPLNTLVEAITQGSVPSPTVLLIPNLYMKATVKNLPAWRVQAVYDLLLLRAARNKPTVVYVESLKGVVETYGQPFHDFLNGFRLVHEDN
jgi:hypothetical protein